MAGTTLTSGIEVAKILRQYWGRAGWTVENGMLTTALQAGVRITRPDVWVVRVSLLGIASVGAPVAVVGRGEIDGLALGSAVGVRLGAGVM